MNEHSNEYRNGQTQPQKNRNGLIAFLLICVIFLCGVVSALGLMNIRLFRQLQEANPTAPLSFAQGDSAPVEPEGDSLTVGGITVQEMPAMYQQIYNLPAGLYVIDAPAGGPVAPGDVLTEFDGAAVVNLEELKALYAKKKAGDRLWFTFHREGNTFSYTVPFEN